MIANQRSRRSPRSSGIVRRPNSIARSQASRGPLRRHPGHNKKERRCTSSLQRLETLPRREALVVEPRSKRQLVSTGDTCRLTKRALASRLHPLLSSHRGGPTDLPTGGSRNRPEAIRYLPEVHGVGGFQCPQHGPRILPSTVAASHYSGRMPEGLGQSLPLFIIRSNSTTGCLAFNRHRPDHEEGRPGGRPPQSRQRWALRKGHFRALGDCHGDFKSSSFRRTFHGPPARWFFKKSDGPRSAAESAMIISVVMLITYRQTGNT